MDSSNTDHRFIYEHVLERAFRFAERHVAWDQALEIAHDVASSMVTREAGQITSGFIYRAVINRVRNQWRSAQRRSNAERAHHQDRADSAEWRDPLSELAARELQHVVEQTIAEMPRAMRETFALVREHDFTYKEAAAHLGVAVGTVHAQLSRANAVLRRAIEAYRLDQVRPHTRVGREA